MQNKYVKWKRDKVGEMRMPLTQIGRKVRMLRKTRGLTLREVAEEVGISSSYLSQFESGKVGIAFSTLVRLAHYFEQNVSDLVRTFDEEPRPLLSRSDGRPLLVVNDKLSIEWLVADPTCRMEVDITIIRPGGSAGGTYSHEGEELCYVLQGEVDVTVGSEKYKLHQGDMLYFSSETAHEFVNEGEEEARVLWCTTPPTV